MTDTINVANASIASSTVTGTMVATGSLDAINSYAPLIGLCLTFTSISLAVVFFIIGHNREKHRIKVDNASIHNMIKLQILQELNDASQDETSVEITDEINDAIHKPNS